MCNVMYSTISCTVTIHSTICKNTSNVKVAIIQLSNDNFFLFWRRQHRQNCCSLPASCLNMHDFSHKGYLFSLITECPRPEFGNTFQERLLVSRKSKTKCHNFNSTYLVHFNVLFLSLSSTPDYSERSHDDSGTYVHTNWMDAIEIIAIFIFFFAENNLLLWRQYSCQLGFRALFFLGGWFIYLAFLKRKSGLKRWNKNPLKGRTGRKKIYWKSETRRSSRIWNIDQSQNIFCHMICV